MKIFVLTVSQVYDYEELELVVRAFKKEEDALKDFAWWKENEFKDLPQGWVIDDDQEGHYSMCAEGDWTRGHVEVSVTSVELN